MKRLNHIQVLRALCVLAVFVYHQRLDFLSSGYLGVDIFFVISGYVISSKIYYDYTETGKINLLNFYKNRIKRIFPLLFFFLFVSYIFIILFYPAKFALGTSLYETITALFGLSNLFFLYKGQSYFDNNLDSPLLHTWSLGVEEQFYLVYPLLIFFLFKKFDIKNSTLILFFFLLASLLSQIFFEIDDKTKFFFPLFRFWELLSGAVLFFYTKGKNTENFKLFTFSLISIIFLFFSKNDNLIILNFLSVFLSCVFISTYNYKYLNSIMSNKILIFVGNISFSFYLWHYLIIFYLNYYFKMNNLIFLTISLVLTFLVSSLTYKFIEQQFRYGNYSLNRSIFFILPSSFLIMFILLTSSTEAYWGNHGKKRYLLMNNFNYLNNNHDIHNRFFFFNKKIGKNLAYRFCKNTINRSDKLVLDLLKPECLKKNYERNILYYLEGNSFMAQYIDIFNENNEINFYYKHRSDKNYSYKEVNKINLSFKKLIYVISINDKKDLKNFKTNLKYFDKNIEYLVFAPNPNMNQSNPLVCLIKKQPCIFDSNNDKKSAVSKEIIKNLKNMNNHKIKIIDVYKNICPSQKCSIYQIEKNLLLFRDKTHLSREGAMLLYEDVFSKRY